MADFEVRMASISLHSGAGIKSLRYKAVADNAFPGLKCLESPAAIEFHYRSVAWAYTGSRLCLRFATTHLWMIQQTSTPCIDGQLATVRKKAKGKQPNCFLDANTLKTKALTAILDRFSPWDTSSENLVPPTEHIFLHQQLLNCQWQLYYTYDESKSKESPGSVIPKSKENPDRENPSITPLYEGFPQSWLWLSWCQRIAGRH
ncbi:hypothetical protein HZ326_4910 [Fusarium oxysporum f. sp. albedinis]|nr:hypothetical protein HZ326_4910 [Fusarium oxysporum f. sp. albedinis]